nr:zinc transporter ZIP6 isoform X2 [Paramormyrops kingsleyae]
MAVMRQGNTEVLWGVFLLCWLGCLSDVAPNCTTTQAGPQGQLLSAVNTQVAEQMQRRQLEELFRRYGENGTISLDGLKRLLKSVGLAHVRQLNVRHREHSGLGYEEGGRQQHRHHGHHGHPPHQHSDFEEVPHRQGSAGGKRVAKSSKDPRDEAALGKKTESSDAHHNLYVKKGPLELSTTPVYTTNILLKSQEVRARRNADTDQPRDGPPADGEANPTSPGPASSGPQISNLLVTGEQSLTVPTHQEVPDLRKSDKEEHDQDHEHDHDHDQDHDQDHDHSHDQDHDHSHDQDHDHSHDQDHDHSHDQDHDHSHDQDHDQHHDHDHNHEHPKVECLNASRLLTAHGMTSEMVLSLTDFGYLCPALLNQIDSKSCIRHQGDHHCLDHDHKHCHHSHHEHTNTSPKTTSIHTEWLGGFVSITIISLLSLLGVVLIPLMNRIFFKFLLSFLVALAVGTLSGDAFLHLIPHSQKGHHHTDHGVEAHDEHASGLDPVWKGLTALSGVYLMFLIEHFLTLGKMYKEKKLKSQKKWDHNEDNTENKLPAVEDTDGLKPAEDVEMNGAGGLSERPNFMSDPSGQGVAEEEQVMLAPPAVPEGYDAYTSEDCENKCHSHFHDTVGQPDDLHHHHHDYHHILHHHHSQNHHPHSHSHPYSQQHFQEAGVATLAWMVIMGDGLHNFSDGLAIGAAFTESLSSGLSTSVAVFCHELPHELGDFAVLLKAGMTVKQAILYNVLSAMMAYLGMITGILIGHYAENVSMWIFALTAGLFMYVALVDMMPEMLHNNAGDHGFSHCGYFLLQNAGILLGFSIMLLIAIFEHKIQLDLGP